MKKIKLLFFFLLGLSIPVLAQWTIQDPGFPEKYEVKHVQVINTDLVWVAAIDNSGNNQQSYYSVTEDGGSSWTTGMITDQNNLAPGQIFTRGYFPLTFTVLHKIDPEGSGQAGLYLSDNKGTTWNRMSGVYEHPDAFPDFIHIWDDGQAITVGDPVEGEFDIYLSSDFGISWAPLPVEFIPDPLEGENAIIHTFSVIENTIWFSTTKGRVFKSTDNGFTWTVSSTPFTSFTRVIFTSSDHGYVQDVGQWTFSQLAETNDGGETWELIEFTGDVLNWDLKYIPDTPNILVSTGAYLRNGMTMSLDGGYNWNPVIENYKVFQMDWFDWQTGWAGGVIDIYPDSWKPVMMKYTGPGLGDFMISPLEYEFGNVYTGQGSTFGMVFTNLGTDQVEITTIESFSTEFTVSPSSFIVEPNSQYTVNVTFTPSGEGYFEGELAIHTTHPQLPEWSAILRGYGVIPPPEFDFMPAFFDETLQTGEQLVANLAFTNNSENQYTWDIKTVFPAPLVSLGWQSGSTVLDEDDGILGSSPDQAMFIKDIDISTPFGFAMLRLGFDDAIRVWVNGALVLDDVFAVHNLNYWDQEIDITPYLMLGINRISAVVFNGVFEGGGGGAFDCELEIDGQLIIKRGDGNYGTPEATWFYYGQTNQVLEPPKDMNGLNWWDKEYGRYPWLSLNIVSGSSTGNEFSQLGWNTKHSPFGGDEIILTEAPDNAFFCKDIEISNPGDIATLYLAFDDGCQVYINGVMAFDFWDGDHGAEYWNETVDASGWFTNGRNRISIVVFNGMYAGCCSGYLDVWLEIGGQSYIAPGGWYPEDPVSEWFVFGQSGQITEPALDSSGRPWYNNDYALGAGNPFTELGWMLQSAPVADGMPALGDAPDNMQLIKDIEIGNYESATLFLAYDDGCRVWINGMLEFDFAYDVHNLNYWDQELDVSWILSPGKHRIAVEVYNGIYGGGGQGGFDCQLIVDGQEVIKRGDLNNGAPEALWYMFGKSGDVLTPPYDANGIQWYQPDYASTATIPSDYLEGTIEPWETGQVQVVLNAKGLQPGDYSGQINFRNTVTQQTTEIPVDLHVYGAPVLKINPVALDFEDYYLSYPETQSLTITNTGSETLEIYELFTLDGVISLAWGQTIYEPGQSNTIDVTIDPYITGDFTSAVVIITNDPVNPETFVNIHANVINAPDIELPFTEYLYSVLETGASELQEFSIYNNGESPSGLEFTIQQGEYKAAGNGDQIVIFYDDMENGVNGWKSENYLETQTQWHLTNFSSNSPTHAWWCGNELTGTYYNRSQVFEAIISPAIQLPAFGNTITLEFNERYIVEEGYDALMIDISSDGGENWYRLRENVDYFPGSWITTSIDISAFAQNEIMIKFLINTGDDVANFFPGWFIDDVRIYTPSFPFLSVEPVSGTVNAGENQQILVTFDASGYDPGIYQGYFLIKSNDPDESFYYLSATLEVIAAPITHFISIPQGWSGLSSYIQPIQSNLPDVFTPVESDLVIAQTLTGMYYPGENINTIGEWYPQSAYKVKFLSAVELPVFGYPETNKTLYLNQGWNLTPVICDDIWSIDDAAEQLGENLTLVKEIAGNHLYWPAYNIRTLNVFTPGNAYFIHITDEGNISFPPNIFKSSPDMEILQSDPVSPWNTVTYTGNSHIVAIPASILTGFSTGDVIGVFSHDGQCRGFVTITNAESNLAMVANGDDASTASKDGLNNNEPLIFKIFKAASGETIELEVTFDNTLPDRGNFVSHGISALAGLKTSLDGSTDGLRLTLSPNPTSGKISISSDRIPESIDIETFEGERVFSYRNLTDTNTEIDLSGLPSGVYVAKIRFTEQLFFRRIVKL